MAASAVAAVAAGALLGFAASLVPGLHVNTLAALVVAAAVAGVVPVTGAPLVALALVAALAASALAAPVAGAFLGATSDESAAAALPAHVLLEEGRGAEAADLGALGTFGGLAVGLALAAALRPLLGPPLDGFSRLESAMPVLLLAVALALLAAERRRVPYLRALAPTPWGRAVVDGVVDHAGGLVVGGRSVTVADADALADAPRGERVQVRGDWTRVHGPWSRALGVALGASVFALAGLLGWIAFRLGAASPLGLPATPLLPLLAGLFGAPQLLELARRPRERAPPQVAGRAAEPWPRVARAVVAGTVPGAGIGLFPGLTPAHAGAAALAWRPAARPEDVLLVLGAANGAGVAFSLLAFTTFDRPRAGALLAAGIVEPARPWLAYAAAALAAATLAYFLARAAAVALARLAGRVPERALAGGVLGVVVASTWAFTGALGLVTLATAAAVGTLPLRWRVRRSHCMGVVMLPVLLRLWG